MSAARTIRVTIDSSGAKKGASEVKSELAGLATATNKATKSQSELTRAANDNSKGLVKLSHAADQSSRSVDRLNSLVKAFVGIQTVKAVIGLADGFTRFTNSLKVANVEGTQQKIVIDRLYASAQKYGVELEAMGALYGKASQAQQSLAASQADLLKFTDSVAAALKVQGGSVADAAGALHQLGQVITGSKVQAEEYNSILDGAFPILQAVAAGSEKYRGSVAALTKDVKAGNVTSKQFFDDFLAGSSMLEERAAKANFTVAASWQVLTNALTKYVGEADQANGTTAALSGGIRGLANNLDTIIPVVATLGLALGVGFVTRAVAASVAAAGAATAMGGLAIAARGAGMALMAAFGGPIGIAITAVTLGLVGMYSQSQRTKAALQETAKVAAEFGVELNNSAQAALTASGETAGIGIAAKNAEPDIWSFANASGNLTDQLYAQAKAARAARVELLQTKLAEANQRIDQGLDATWHGASVNAGKAREALSNGDILATAEYGWKAASARIAGTLSNGRTAREGTELALANTAVATAIRKELNEALTTPIGAGDLPAGGGGAPADEAEKSKRKGKSDAERRLEAAKEFWAGLDQEHRLSTKIGIEREKQAKILEYQKIVGRDITAEEEQSLRTVIDQTRANEFLVQAYEQNRKAQLDYQKEAQLVQAKLNGMSDEQLTAERAALDFKQSIQEQNLNLDEATLATLTDQVRQRALENAELEKRKKLISEGEAAAAKYSASYALNQQAKGFENERSALAALYDGGNNPNFTKAEYEEAVKGLDKAIGDAARQSKYRMVDEWGDAITQISQEIGGKWGKAIGVLGDAISSIAAAAKGDVENAGPLGRIAGMFGDASKEAFSKANADFLGDLGKQFNSIFGKNSQFGKTIGSALGKANAGFQAGAIVGDVMKGLGIKTSGTGAKIGGAIGNMVGGPIGSIAGSIIGGVFGGLFKKAKWGTASVTNGNVSTRGNKQTYEDNAATAANSIVSGVEGIAEQLGVDATGNYSVSIGQYKGKWRVSTTGRTGKLKDKYAGVEDFGKDGAEAALQFAIQDAIKDGALAGLRASTKALLSMGDDLEAQMRKALKFEGVFKELQSRLHPITYAVDALNLEFKNLGKIFKEAGATAEEYAQLEELRSLRMKDLMDQNLSGFRDTLDMIRGDASGKSQLTLFNEQMAQLSSYRNTLASGETVDDDKFNSLVQDIVGRASDIYGTQTAEYQGVLNDLGSLVDTAMDNATSEFEKAAAAYEKTTDAVVDQTNQITSKIDTTNGMLAAILRVLEGKNAAFANAGTAANGKLLVAN